MCMSFFLFIYNVKCTCLYVYSIANYKWTELTQKCRPFLDYLFKNIIGIIPSSFGRWFNLRRKFLEASLLITVSIFVYVILYIISHVIAWLKLTVSFSKFIFLFLHELNFLGEIYLVNEACLFSTTFSNYNFRHPVVSPPLATAPNRHSKNRVRLTYPCCGVANSLQQFPARPIWKILCLVRKFSLSTVNFLIMAKRGRIFLNVFCPFSSFATWFNLLDLLLKQNYN